MAGAAVPAAVRGDVLAAETTWFKLVLWRDFASWGLGIAAGVALAALRAVFLQRSTRPSSVS